MKGCPLHCVWCHNPESWLEEPQKLFKAGKCIGCLSCVDVCPQGLDPRKALSENTLVNSALRSLDRQGDRCLLFEVGEGQAEEVISLLRSAGFSAVDTRKDVHGTERVVIGQL